MIKKKEKKKQKKNNNNACMYVNNAQQIDSVALANNKKTRHNC